MPRRHAATHGCSTTGDARRDRTHGAAHVSTQRDRHEETRREKLRQIQEQVEKGDLTIRKMTPAERAKHPPRPPAPRRKRY